MVDFLFWIALQPSGRLRVEAGSSFSSDEAPSEVSSEDPSADVVGEISASSLSSAPCVSSLSNNASQSPEVTVANLSNSSLSFEGDSSPSATDGADASKTGMALKNLPLRGAKRSNLQEIVLKAFHCSWQRLMRAFGVRGQPI